MTVDQGIVFGILTGALILFMGGRPRYDVVALLALLAAVFADIVEPQEAFLGFGHPAVVTVAAVLIVSRALRNSGVADVIAGWLSRVGDRPAFQVPVLTGAVVPFSAFINDVGALALLMPVAIELARKAGNPPSRLLMPLAFGSLLGPGRHQVDGGRPWAGARGRQVVGRIGAGVRRDKCGGGGGNARPANGRPFIILLGAMIPVGQAIETTGGA